MSVWTEVPAFLLGLLTLAVTTNTFARRSTRRLRDVRARAELLDHLPDGPAREELARHVDAAVLGLVRDWEAPSAPRRSRDLVLMSVAVVAAAVWVGAASTAVVWDDRPDWVQNLSLSGLVIAAICTTIMAVMNRRQGGHPDTARSAP